MLQFTASPTEGSSAAMGFCPSVDIVKYSCFDAFNTGGCMRERPTHPESSLSLSPSQPLFIWISGFSLRVEGASLQSFPTIGYLRSARTAQRGLYMFMFTMGACDIRWPSFFCSANIFSLDTIVIEVQLLLIQIPVTGLPAFDSGIRRLETF
jgi:hypothetical protein